LVAGFDKIEINIDKYRIGAARLTRRGSIKTSRFTYKPSTDISGM
jgi:hypothetical protein